MLNQTLQIQPKANKSLYAMQNAYYLYWI